jgi:hypothetical protein
MWDSIQPISRVHPRDLVGTRCVRHRASPHIYSSTEEPPATLREVRPEGHLASGIFFRISMCGDEAGQAITPSTRFGKPYERNRGTATLFRLL